MFQLNLALCSILAAATGKELYGSEENRTDAFIKYSEQVYLRTIKEFDSKIQSIDDHFFSRMEPLYIHQDLLKESILETEQSLDALEFLNGNYKRCVSHYRFDMDSADGLEEMFQSCCGNQTELDELKNRSIGIRDSLYDYFHSDLKNEIHDCKLKAKTSEEYYSCASRVISKGKEQTFALKNNFEELLDTIKCKVEDAVKRILDCSYDALFDIASEIALADFKIKRCISAACKPCVYHCEMVAYIETSELPLEKVNNPFYGGDDHPQCFLLTVSDSEPPLF